MDELESDLRATLGSLGAGDEPSDALVARTQRRATHLRWQRRAVAATTIAAVIGVASIAAGQTRNEHVTTPLTTPTSSIPSTSASSSTTMQRQSTSTSIEPGGGSSQPKPGGSTVTTSPTPPTTEPPLQCGPPPVIEDWSPPYFETLENGDVRVSIGGRPTGPANETWVYAWDDGSPEPTRTFTPEEFGPHWYDLYWELNGIQRSCPQRVEIVIGPQGSTTTAP